MNGTSKCKPRGSGGTRQKRRRSFLRDGQIGRHQDNMGPQELRRGRGRGRDVRENDRKRVQRVLRGKRPRKSREDGEVRRQGRQDNLRSPDASGIIYPPSEVTYGYLDTATGGSEITATWAYWNDDANNKLIVTDATSTAANTWDSWSFTVDSGTATATTNDLTWTEWNTGTNAVRVHTSDGSWSEWLRQHTNANHYREIANPPFIPYYPEETEEQKAQRVIREQQQELKRKDEELRRQKARLEALSLLDSILDDIQRETFAQEDWFLVIGKSGKIYRLRRGRVGNIDLISPEGKLLKTFCVHPTPMLPNGDDLVAQKLHLEHDDDALIRRSNTHRTYGEDAPVIDISTRLPVKRLRKAA